MAELCESKQQGALTILDGLTAKTVSAPLPAAVHLFENRYDRGTHFWYGVAEVGAEAPAAYLRDPAAFRLRVELADGRRGHARHWSGAGPAGAASGARIAFVCETELVVGE